MCTGYGREGSSPDLIQYHEEQTIVFLMAVGRLRELCQRLISLAGYPKDTPVGIIENAGCPTLNIIRATYKVKPANARSTETKYAKQTRCRHW